MKQQQIRDAAFMWLGTAANVFSLIANLWTHAWGVAGFSAAVAMLCYSWARWMVPFIRDMRKQQALDIETATLVLERFKTATAGFGIGVDVEEGTIRH